ncbi:MAG: bifunctional hydroxymethylpyrimidine kinase/phosphomethylpyrimidine kinase [Elusimicrobiota bacterium]|jgi:hydroxymethylpyrimidine/phosphomethylpyrimidine kinase|nr:bifunctional hydroxymethylpyrimidine kinase/phosphomethylpyrimidine kinase [Elusimicrobiota bacterium]
MKTVLTIAGSDCSGGAGIQADIKTIAAHKLYAMSAITALTAQNTMGVYGAALTKPYFITKQIDCIFADIVPDAVKIGMLANAAIIEAVALSLKKYKAKNIVVDPVMISTSGRKLINVGAVTSLKKKLFSLAVLITPNIPEAEVLSGVKIKNKRDMFAAARKIYEDSGASVLVKGGHLKRCADDILYCNGKTRWFKGEKINNPNNHGTGCTLSSAIACNLATGRSLEQSIQNAKNYITGALKAGIALPAKGAGPLNHCYNLRFKTTRSL